MVETLLFVNITKKKIIVTTLLIVVISLVLEIWSLNRLATFGDQIVKFESATADLSLENQMLENEIAKRSAFKTISEAANSIGFKRTTHVEFVSPPTVAYNN